MPGPNTSGTMPKSLEVIIDSARAVREYPFVFNETTEQHKIPANSGLNWDEIAVGKMTAQTGITELTELDNPQLFTEDVIRYEPIMSGINWIVTDKMKARTSVKTLKATGEVAMNAINRQTDKAYLSCGQTATTTRGSAGTSITIGHLNAMRNFVEIGNAVEPANGKVYGIIHQWQNATLEDAITTTLGTYPIPTGLSEDVIKRGFKGNLAGTNLMVDNNLTPDANDDVEMFVHVKEAIVLIRGLELRRFTKPRPELGGGATEYFIYEDLAFGERSVGNWLISGLFDAVAQTA